MSELYGRSSATVNRIIITGWTAQGHPFWRPVGGTGRGFEIIIVGAAHGSLFEVTYTCIAQIPTRLPRILQQPLFIRAPHKASLSP